ncbi:Rho GTPase-activating protein 2 [Raphanus sativus]|uniref:Rho GTPase-activating protein 2 n=1 Tax=Raphanus sativus TaxID=3726 RepID=A0A6J0LDJ4_RAPSA|nr:rho GTPase-activating protein 2 [Raphanus sativus]KAJ4876534.1 Rho GTPase-activating protein 2 [Raphanus sativus]
MTGLVMVTKSTVGCGGGKGGGGGGGRSKPTVEEEEQNQQLSLVEFLLTALRKSVISCRVDNNGQDDVVGGGGISSAAVHHMEIGWPTNVRHITHVTFDRFHGFLGLPHELQVEIPCRVPSASVSVFGVSAESMQCSYDQKGNSVPTILLLMQQRLYSQQGLKAEGIFRINPENSQEEQVRDQLNRGVVPENIDVHCLAALIKAWFRELPCGVLDGLSPEEVLNCNTEEESVELIKQLKPTESALLNWAVDLMADVVEEEEFNKMNARNIAMVFAPNMTQMTDPLTALMHAVQVMNLLKTLITRTLAEREGTTSGSEGYSPSHSSNSQTDSDSDNAQDMEVSCESQGTDSESGGEEEQEQQDENDIGSLSSIENCFLSQLNNNARVSNSSMSEDLSPKCSPVVSFTDSKNNTLSSSKSDQDEAMTV